MTSEQTGSEARSTQSERRPPLVGCALVLAFAPILLFALFLTCVLWPPRVSVGEVERDVAKHLPLGSSEDKILAFLEERNIEHSDPYEARGYNTIPGAPEVSEGTLVIQAIIRDTSRPFQLETHILLYFILDDRGRLTRFEAEEVSDFL